MILRDYQIEIAKKGLDILKRYNLLYLAMQTRTGKTLTALTICKDFNNVIFVTKKKVIKSIENDYKKSGYRFNITIINYDSLHKIDDTFDVVICDEAHCLGAFPKPSKRTKELKRFTINKPVIFLSATPAPESWSQLYHQFWISSFSQFEQYSNFYKWAHQFVNIKKKYLYNRELNDYTDAKKELIWQEIKHLFITKTQTDAGFTISVDEEILYVKTSEIVKKVISTLLKNKIYIHDDLEIIADTAVKLMNKVHQLCSGSVIDEKGYQILSNYKAEYLYNWNKDKRIAIFYKFKSELEIIKNVFKNTTEDFTEFQSGKYDVFVGQFQSTREGIRLDKADAIVFFNIDYSYLSYEQARNRIASFERTKKAKLYWLFSDSGIEKRIYKTVKNKQDYTTKFFKNDRESIRAEME